MVGGSGPAALVLARPVFLKVEIKLYLYKKQLINKSASVTFGFDKLNILNYNRYKKHIKMYKIIGHPCIKFIVMLTRYSVVQKAK